MKKEEIERCFSGLVKNADAPYVTSRHVEDDRYGELWRFCKEVENLKSRLLTLELELIKLQAMGFQMLQLSRQQLGGQQESNLLSDKERTSKE